MSYRLKYSDYSTSEGPPDPSEWVGPPGPAGPVGPAGPQGEPQTGGPFLPLSGGTVSGPVTLAAAPATASGAAIQALLDALPAEGGSVMLAPNTIYTVAALITTTKPNVRITASSWGTILRRDPAYTTSALIFLAGANSTIEGFTVDGNAIVGPTWEVSVSGANSLVRNMQIINGAGTGHLNLSGMHSRATGNTITGLGISLSTERGYGIWAVSHVTVMIDHNVITGTGIDGIGFDGEGSQVIGNHVSDCHCWSGSEGGQIASYLGLGGGVGNSLVVAGNYVGPPGHSSGSGLECWNPGMVVSGNTFDNQPAAAITIFGKATITGNSISNCGFDAIVVTAGVSGFVISGNRIADDKPTPTMRYGIAVYAGASDRYVITGNQIAGNTSSAIFDGGTGTRKVILNNSMSGGAPLLINAANDAAASAAGVSIAQLYRNGSVVMQRTV